MINRLLSLACVIGYFYTNNLSFAFAALFFHIDARFDDLNIRISK
jgi:hypothetical protein